MYKKVLGYGSVALLGILAAVAVTAVFTVMTVRGSGMEPALNDGDKVLINKLAYAYVKPAAGALHKDGKNPATGALHKDGKNPATGDVIAFYSDVYGEEGEGRLLVRRVAGSSGDKIEIKDDVFYLNDRPYDEYMKEPVKMDDMAPIILGGDEVFVLGDNRKSSLDSRNEAIGVLSLEDCVGKVVLKWDPLLH